ncbi:MAG: DinB family protein, partial [Ktedonobacterales bacterium]
VQIASVLDNIGRDVLAQLKGLSHEDLNRPLTLPETNTLFALATHLVGAAEFWVLVLAGGRSIPRDRPAEFRASGSLSDLTARYESWIAGVHEVLDALAPEKMEQRIDLSRYRSSPSPSQEVSVREALLHAVEHSALHLGQIQITRQLLGYSPPEEE